MCILFHPTTGTSTYGPDADVEKALSRSVSSDPLAIDVNSHVEPAYGAFDRMSKSLFGILMD